MSSNAPTVAREMARSTAGDTEPDAIRDLLRSVEVTVIGPAGAARMDLEQLALAKLKLRLKREQEQP